MTYPSGILAPDGSELTPPAKQKRTACWPRDWREHGVGSGCWKRGTHSSMTAIAEE